MPKDKDYWLKKLADQKVELEQLEQEGAEGCAAVELDQQRVGRLSRMDALQSQAMSNAIAQRRKQALQRIEGAIKRLDEGEFGFCMTCGEDIMEKRLELDPTTLYCASCCSTM